MALIIALGIGLLRLLQVPRRWAFWICCPWILFYACAVGADPPVVRAATMAIVALALMALGRDSPRYCPFVLAWLWILVREPEALFGASFQLSFGATASLLAVLPSLQFTQSIRSRWLRWVMDAGIVSVAVHLGVWPLLIYYFHQLSLVGFLANWTLFPLSGFIMVMGLLLGIWGIYLPGSMPPCLIQGMHGILKGCLVAIERMSGWTWAAVPLSAPPWPITVVYYSLLICILFNLERHEQKSIVL
jgi:competence protein ComEC